MICDDELFGGIGDDHLYGDAPQSAGIRQGDDYLDGEDGSDLLVGGGKDDQRFGGDVKDGQFITANDDFTFDAANDNEWRISA